MERLTTSNRRLLGKSNVPDLEPLDTTTSFDLYFKVREAATVRNNSRVLRTLSASCAASFTTPAEDLTCAAAAAAGPTLIPPFAPLRPNKGLKGGLF